MASSIQFDGGLTCGFQVKDLKKAIEWYQEVMGFQLLYCLDEMGWCELSTPVARVNVGLSQVESPQVEGGATLTFGVADIVAAKADLSKSKVQFDGDIMTIEGMVKLQTFFDLDGNKLMIYQDLQTSS